MYVHEISIEVKASLLGENLLELFCRTWGFIQMTGATCHSSFCSALGFDFGKMATGNKIKPS